MLPRLANVVVRFSDTGEIVDPRDDLSDPDPSPLVYERPDRATVDSLLRNAPGEQDAFTSVPTRNGRVRILTRRLQLGATEIALGFLSSERERLQTMAELRDAWPWVLLVFVLALAMPSAYIRRGAAALGSITERAEEIGQGHPDLRFPASMAREPGLSRLVGALNELLDRSQGSGEEQRTFMAAAAHELRTPVAVISGEAQVALDNDDADARALRGSLRLIRQESRALTRIVEELFLLARMRAREATLQLAPLYLDELVADTASALRRLPGGGGRIDVDVAPGEYPYKGDEALLARALTNLVVNAMRHSPAASPVRVSLGRSTASYWLTVTDQGEGIPVAEQGRVFDRFFRGGRGRARDDGAGLGLAITRGVVEAHGGKVQLVRSGPDGSQFRIDLPVAAGDGGVHGA
jgi:two-component system OmpR family sensor kinase